MTHSHSEIDYDDIPFDDPSPLSPAYETETWYIELQEGRVKSYLAVAQACLVAVENNDVATASKFFCQKLLWVKRRADVYALIVNVFGDERLFLPQISLSLYETAAKTPKPIHWLRMATDPTYRQKVTGEDDGLNVWSARHLTDMAGLGEGKTVSDVPQIAAGTEGDVAEWEAGYVAFDIEGFEPAGKRPVKVRFTGKLVEVL